MDAFMKKRLPVKQVRTMLLIILFGAVLPKAAFAFKDSTDKIRVFELKKAVPATAKVVGTFKIGDKGFTTDCQYQRVIEKAQEKALKAGGNAIQITELKEPDFFSTCYRIKGNILLVEDSGEVLENNTIEKKELVSTTADTATYAIIYFYRPKNFSGSAVGYDVRLDDSVVCRMVNNSKAEIRVYKQGKQKVWAKTEAKAIVPLDVKYGKHYYIKCTIAMGLWVGQPSLNLIDPEQGQYEYEMVKGRNK